MNNGFSIYICDSETSGLDPELHDVIEVSFKRLIPQDNLTFQEEQKTWLLRALNPKTITEKALAVNGHLLDDVLGISKNGKENYIAPAEAVSQIENWIMEDGVSSMDRVFVGQNPMFDVKMLQSLWKKVGRTDPLDFPFAVENGNRIIDTRMITTFFDLCTGKRRKAYGLGSLVKACSVKKEKSHRADGDTRMTCGLLLKFMEMVRPVVIEKFGDCYLAEDRE